MNLSNLEIATTIILLLAIIHTFLINTFAKYFSHAGAVPRGGLIVIVNAPNLAGFENLPSI